MDNYGNNYGSNYTKKPNRDKNSVRVALIIAIILLIIAVLIFLAALIIKNNFTESQSKVERIYEGVEIEESVFGKDGGTVIVFEPDVEDLSTISASDMDAAENIIRTRLDYLNYPEAKISRQGKIGLRVEIPGLDDPQQVVKQICATAKLEFLDADGNLIMDAQGNVKEATAVYGQTTEYGSPEHYVQLTFTSEGSKKFAEATKVAVEAGPGKNIIAIALDGVIQMAPTVNEVIASDKFIMTGNYTKESANDVADLINSGLLSFSLEATETHSFAL